MEPGTGVTRRAAFVRFGVGYLNSVQAFSARTGKELWSYPAKGLVTKVAGSGDTVYAAADPGGPGYTLYALRGRKRAAQG